MLAQRVLVSGVSSRWRTVIIPQGQHWFQLMICMMEQTVSSANLLMVQNLEDQLIDQWVTGPSKGTRTVWRKWADRNLAKVNKGKCEVLHLGRSKPRRMGYTMGAGRLESSFAGRAFGGFGCHQIEHNQAVCTHLWPIG